MKHLTLIGGILLASSLPAFGQWSISEQATDFSSKYNCASVEMTDGDVFVGSINFPHVDSIDFEMYTAEVNSTVWGTAPAINNTSGYMYVRNVKFLTSSIGFATFTHIRGYGGQGTRHTIIKTTDGGLTWSMKSQTPTIVSGLTAIEGLDFFDNNHGIAAGVMPLNDDLWGADPSAWVSITQDGGETWSKVTLPTSMHHRGIYGLDILNSTTAFVIMRDSDVGIPNSSKKFYVFKTTDRGLTWSEVYSDLFPSEYATFIPSGFSIDLEAPDIDFSSENIGWIIFNAAKLQSYIYKTTDGGATWAEVDHPIKESEGLQDIDFQKVQFVDDNEGFIVGGNHCSDIGCFRGSSLIHTSNGGLDWEVIRYDNNGPALIDMDYDPVNRVGYAVGGGIASGSGAIFRFENGALDVDHLDAAVDQFTVYPNPSSGTLLLNSSSTEKTIVRIVRPDGRLVQEQVLVGGTARFDLQPGLYFVQHGAQTKKVIVH